MRTWEEKPEWLDETRRQPRWCDVRTALAKVEGDEYLGKVRDVSLGGLGLTVSDVRTGRGAAIAVCVVFEDRVIEMRGRVAYWLPRNGESRIGVSVPDLCDEARKYLTARYVGNPLQPAVS